MLRVAITRYLHVPNSNLHIHAKPKAKVVNVSMYCYLPAMSVRGGPNIGGAVVVSSGNICIPSFVPVRRLHTTVASGKATQTTNLDDNLC